MVATHKYYKLVVWLLRIFVGATFIFSGFVKCIDPRGFVYKITEYLQVWHIDWLWQETVYTIAVALSTIEFCCGFALITGCMRRVVCWCMALFMAFMLPLTVYIAIANPVADCGCFGDAYVISNTATLLKNIVLTAAIVYLIFFNSKVPGIYPPLSQVWPMILSVLYCLILALIGITVQPFIDFRPFKVGTQLVEDKDETMRLVYEKDGNTESFALDALPDSTWTYVGRETKESDFESGFAVFDGDDDVTSQVIETVGEQVLLIISDPETHNKSRSSMANNINDYVTSRGGSMIGVLDASPKVLEQWKEVASPHFEVYTSDDTTLKQLVRGDAGIVYLVDGKIKWKRNIFSLNGDFPDFSVKDNELEKVYVVDSGRPFMVVTGVYLGALLILALLGLIRIKNEKKSTEKAID